MLERFKQDVISGRIVSCKYFAYLTKVTYLETPNMILFALVNGQQIQSISAEVV